MPLVLLEETLQKELDALTSSDDPKRIELREKIEIVMEIRVKIRPINAQRYEKNALARSNCVYVAEECVRVLSGRAGKTHQAPLRRKNLTITDRRDNNNIVYHEVLSKEQADLVSFQDFTETISLLDDKKSSTEIDLSLVSSRGIAKYIQSNLNNLASDLKNIPGTADSNGDDKTLTGLIYYYYENIDAGHLANFYRSKQGYLFFVDAQSEEITESPPEKIFNANIRKNSIFYFIAKPKLGYYVKKEQNTAVNAMIKKEHEDTDMVFTTTTTQSTNDNSELNSLNSNETVSVYQSQHSSFSSNSTRFWNEVPGHDENNNNISETRTTQITSGPNLSSIISNLNAEMQQLDQDLEALKNISSVEDAFKLYPLFGKFINFLDKLLNLSSSAAILKALKLHLEMVTAKFVELGLTLCDQKKWLGSDFNQRSKEITEKIFKLNSKIMDHNSYISPTLKIQLSSINLSGIYLDHWILKNCTLKINSNFMYITPNTKFCGKNILPPLNKKTLDALLMIDNLNIYYTQANHFVDVSTGYPVDLKKIDQKAKEKGVVICSNNAKELKLSYSPHGIYKRIHSANQKIVNLEKQTEELNGNNKKLEAENAKLKMELEALREKQSHDQNSSEEELENRHYEKRVKINSLKENAGSPKVSM